MNRLPPEELPNADGDEIEEDQRQCQRHNRAWQAEAKPALIGENHGSQPQCHLPNIAVR